MDQKYNIIGTSEDQWTIRVINGQPGWCSHLQVALA